MNDGYYSIKELSCFGFASIGDNVLISKKASIYCPEMMSIGSNVRVDDFCFLVGNITIGDYVHIAPYAGLHGTGGGRIVIKDFCGIAANSQIYAGSDDFHGDCFANPQVPLKFRKCNAADIVFEKHVTLGLSCVVLPGAYLAEGVVVNAMSLVYRKLKAWGIYAGIPCKRVADRSKRLIELEALFRQEESCHDK